MWGMAGIAVAAGIAAGVFWLKYRMLKNCVRQAARDMAEIMENPQENRILRVADPSEEAERLFIQVNRYIQYHRQEQVAWQQQEEQLQEQIENISHDLRTPLTAILGYLELVDAGGLSEEDKEALEVVERRSRYLQGLINDFYDLSRLEQSHVRLEAKPVEATGIIRETMLSYYPEFEKRHLELELELPETEVLIEGDQNALERIIHNIIQNALRYARSRFRVCIHQAKARDIGSKDLVCMEFCNDTEHLSQADIPLLFERFYTADHARPGGGTGLGLTVSKLFTEAMGGTVTAQLTGRQELRLLFTFLPAMDRQLSRQETRSLPGSSIDHF